MLTAMLLSTLAAGPALPDADLVLQAPQIRGAQGVSAFLEQAGARAPVLRDSQALLLPLLGAEALDATRLSKLGIQSAGSLTASVRGGVALSCFQVADAKLLDAALAERLGRYGATEPLGRAGLHASGRLQDGRRSQVAWARWGTRACTWSAPGGQAASAEVAALAALKAPTGARAGAKGITLQSDLIHGTLDGDTRSLRFEGLARLRRLPPLGMAGASPYVGMAKAGTAQALVRVDPRRVPEALSPFFRRALAVCGSCPRGLSTTLSERLGAALTGNAVLRVGTFRPTDSGLRSDLGRLRALPTAVLFELSPKARNVTTLLAPLAELEQAEKIAGGYRLTLSRGATLTLAVQDGHLLLTTEEALGESLLAAVPAKGGRQAHALELQADPRATALGLRRIPLLESLADPQLAALLVISNTVGPLLEQSEPLTLTVDPVRAKGGRARLQATWTLTP